MSGETGQAVEWLPLNVPTELPGFVEHFKGIGFKVGLGGTIRMETPVLYFYSTHDTTIDVSVSFFHGLITEWYPHASKVEPSSSIENVVQFQQQSNGSIAWKSVHVEPSAAHEFVQEAQPSHYYAARAVAASPLRVAAKHGDQQEQFLFYRGVSVAAPPLSALVMSNGQVEAMNQTADEIAKLFFSNAAARRSAIAQRLPFAKEQFSVRLLSMRSLDSLLSDLEASLIDAGLYPDEAHAMLESWKDSWFEEGSRLIYIVPNSFVEQILPLSIRPEPMHVNRVFVGRMELLTPATQRAIETAVGSHDDTTLAKYGRFLAPMIETILRKGTSPAETDLLSAALQKIYITYIAQNSLR